MASEGDDINVYYHELIVHESFNRRLRLNEGILTVEGYPFEPAVIEEGFLQLQVGYLAKSNRDWGPE